MNPDQGQQLQSQHQPETFSTANVQTFEDSEGGVPLDAPLVRAREKQRQAKPASRRLPSEKDSPS
jgi:hypothetical protein